jgi:hypothetical protein
MKACRYAYARRICPSCPHRSRVVVMASDASHLASAGCLDRVANLSTYQPYRARRLDCNLVISSDDDCGRVA